MNNKNYKWVVVGLLWFVCFFNYADRQAIFSVFIPIGQEMGLSKLQLSWVGAAFMYVYALAGPLAGIIGDRFSRKFLIIAGLVFWSVVTMGTALATDYWHLLFVRALEGFGEAFYFPASMALIADYHDSAGTKSRAMGIHQSSVACAVSVSVMVLRGGSFRAISNTTPNRMPSEPNKTKLERQP